MTEDFENETTLTIADLLDRHIQTRDQMMELFRARWINQVLLQLVSARISAEVTQAELAQRMGRHQSAIGRLERGDDIKLSTLFDYLSALERIPDGQIATLSQTEAFARVTRAAGPRKEQELMTFPEWLRGNQRPAKYGTSPGEQSKGRPTPATASSSVVPTGNSNTELESPRPETLAA